MKKPFDIGDKVVCVDAKNPSHAASDPLQEGATYVVSGIHKCPPNVPGSYGVHLVGMISAYGTGYCHWRFRKLSDIQQENRLKREMAKRDPVEAMRP